MLSLSDTAFRRPDDFVGIGYTAVTDSIKRAERYLEKNKRTAKLVR